MKANMGAELLLRRKDMLSDGAIVEMVIWKVPIAIAGSRHGYKYRLYYGRDGKRIVGYGARAITATLTGTEHPYAFTTPEALIDDFLAEVKARRKP